MPEQQHLALCFLAGWITTGLMLVMNGIQLGEIQKRLRKIARRLKRARQNQRNSDAFFER